VICGDVAAVEPGSRFDLVCGFEVLEHIEDDAAILREWRERLREGGWLLLSVPAHQRRFGAHDRVVGHYRRYDPGAIASLLERSGFAEPVVLSCGFPLGYLLELARNTLVARLAEPARSPEAQTAASGRWLQPPAWLGPALRAFSAPFRWLQRPFARTGWGTGLVVLARRA
jgi:SAM-dependent methyltransferase